MKKVITILIAALITVILPVGVFADDNWLESDDVLNEIYSYLPVDINENITDDLLEPSFLWQALVDSLKSAFPAATRSFAVILGLVLISAVIGAVRDSIASGGIAVALDFVCTVCVCAAILSCVDVGFGDVTGFVSDLTGLVTASVPVVCTVVATSGRATLSAGIGTVTAVASSILGGVCSGWLIPLSKLNFALLVGGSVCTEFDFSAILSSFKKISTVILALISAAITATVAFQTVITKGADDLIVRGVKFAGSFIPYIGGAVSEAVSTLKGSIGVIGATAGMSTAVIIAVMALTPLVKLSVMRCFTDVSCGVATLLGRKKEGTFFAGLSDIIGVLTAVTAAVSVVFIVAVSALGAAGGE